MQCYFVFFTFFEVIESEILGFPLIRLNFIWNNVENSDVFLMVNPDTTKRDNKKIENSDEMNF